MRGYDERRSRPLRIGPWCGYARMLNIGLAFPESPITMNEEMGDEQGVKSISKGAVRTDDGIIGSWNGIFWDGDADCSIGEREFRREWVG